MSQGKQINMCTDEHSSLNFYHSKVIVLILILKISFFYDFWSKRILKNISATTIFPNKNTFLQQNLLQNRLIKRINALTLIFYRYNFRICTFTSYLVLKKY